MRIFEEFLWVEAWSMVVMGSDWGVRVPGILLIAGPSHLAPPQPLESIAILAMMPIFHMSHFPFKTQKCCHNLPKVTRINGTPS